MAVGRQGPADVSSVTIQDSPGGIARSIHAVLLNGLTIKDFVEIVENTGLGTAWKTRTPTGVQDSDPVTLEAEFNTTGTTGAYAVLGMKAGDIAPNSVGRQLVAVFGDSKTWTKTFHLESFQVAAQNGQISRITAVLQPTGAGVWS